MDKTEPGRALLSSDDAEILQAIEILQHHVTEQYFGSGEAEDELISYLSHLEGALLPVGWEQTGSAERV